MKAVVHGCLAGIVALSLSMVAQAQELSMVAQAQESKSALLAKQLAAALDAGKLDSFAAKDPTNRDVYIDLNSASVLASRVSIEDLGADGLRAKREENRGFDTCEIAGKRTMFDSDWKKQQLTEAEYLKAFSDADEQYRQMLAVLLATLKNGS